jgi:hypothetical protein
MGTRSTTHFVYPDRTEPEAIIYRHWDGYPEGAGKDLMDFLKRVETFLDSRLTDPSYLAARYVAFLADLFAPKPDEPRPGQSMDPLDFISVGVVRQDPSDIEYRYVVICDGSVNVKAYEVSCSYPENVWSETRVEIPA